MNSEHNIPDIFNSAFYLLDRHIEEGRGNKIAVYYEDRTITYGQLLEMANKLGNALRNFGVEQENRVIICLPDSPEFLVSYFGTMKLGAVPVAVNTMATPDDYIYYLNDSRAKTLITSEELAPVFRKMHSQLKYLKHFIVVGTPSDEEFSFEHLLAESSSDLEAVPTSKDDMAFWIYSSGTTGRPKGVIHLHHDVMYFMPPHSREVVSVKENDILYSTSKLFYMYGHNNSIDTPFLYGAAVVLNQSLSSPEKIFATVEKYRPTLFYSVPSSYAAMLNYVDEQKGRPFDLSSIRLFVSAGEALPPVVFQRWKEKFGREILDAIGSTDVGAFYLSNRTGQVRPGSSGKVLPGLEVKLVDPEGHRVPPGEMGILWVNSDGCTPGYWNQHKKTKESFNGVWFNTGDQFYQDEDGYYWYTGRADDMLKPGGRWLSPLEVENILLEHAAVREAAVVGAYDKSGLEKPVAFVVLRPNWSPSESLEREMQDVVRAKTSSYKCPRRIFFVTELPRTASGKVQRYRLRDKLRSLEGPEI